MPRQRLRLPIAAAAILAVWFGVLSTLPHSHIADQNPGPDEVCTAPAADQPTFHLHGTRHLGQRPCLACLASGTSGAATARSPELQPVTVVGGTAPAADILCPRTREHLPSQRGPPTAA